jgi:UPF0755 protein
MNIKDLPSFLLSKKVKIILIPILLLVTGYWLLATFLSPPSDFPINQVITIEKGDSFKKIAADFEKQRLIRSSFWFDTIGWFLRSREKVKAGEYFFEHSLSAIELFKQITENGGKSKFARVTIPEGATIDDIVKIFKKFGFKNFNIEDKSLEGYLFPDTYFVSLGLSSEKIIEIMLDNFESKVTPEMRNKNIIIMASLLEKEAAKTEDRKIISGILWKRLDAGMPLQVDAVFPYIIGKYSLQLTLEDLKTDSPYNTYLYKGLPPGPIANPGLDSIQAALNPTESKYWYYLSDKRGNIYFSASYEEHLIKKAKYLR